MRSPQQWPKLCVMGGKHHRRTPSWLKLKFRQSERRWQNKKKKTKLSFDDDIYKETSAFIKEKVSVNPFFPLWECDQRQQQQQQVTGSQPGGVIPHQPLCSQTQPFSPCFTSWMGSGLDYTRFCGSNRQLNTLAAATTPGQPSTISFAFAS